MQTTREGADTTDAPIIREPFLKRPLDVMLSSVMIILSLPVSLPIACAIKIEDRGPIFYRQERWGRSVAHGTRSKGIAQSVDK
jgi:lipopolysaccharide/colanic/teichoic acid biosynthesis glycosyltransferase